MKITFLKKVLYFLKFSGLNDKIDVKYNSKTHDIIVAIYGIFMFVMILLNINNLAIRLILAFASFYIAVELLYILTIRKYAQNNYKD